MKKFLLGLAVSVLIIFSALGGAIADRLFVIRPLDRITGGEKEQVRKLEQRVVNEESVVIDVASKASPSVVTVSIQKERRIVEPLFEDPFGLFNVPGEQRLETIERDIGTGFVIEGGLIVTNKHVVADSEAEYEVIDNEENRYQVSDIYRDPVNDLAILQAKSSESLPALQMGDSDNIQVGQFAMAIGTALGEFRHTVTTGVISGVGRGIQAQASGYFESLDNVIQTDAAINPGNSGGPLLNSAGQVVAVNVAVAGAAENIGFAIPINVVKESVETFQETGRFERARLGVRYQMISREVAVLNEVPQGAYIVQVTEGGPADKAGIQRGEIIVSVDGQKVSEVKGGLAGIINKKRVGERIRAEIWGEGEQTSVELRLETIEE